MRLDGFHEVVRQAWDSPLNNIDACRVLDFKLRRTAKALQSWSMRNIGSVRFKLGLARELIAQFDAAQESRLLTDEELSLRNELKRHTLGLASLSRTIARHRSRIRYLEEGDANTRFFHLQACHRNRKSYIPSILHDGILFSADEAKEDLIYNYYKSILGTAFHRLHSLRLDHLLPQLDGPCRY